MNKKSFSIRFILIIFFIFVCMICFSQNTILTINDVRSKYPDLDQYNEVALNNLGYQLIKQDKIEEAIEIFRFNCKTYPESWNVYDSLAEAYMITGERDLAILNYEKSIELNPASVNGKRILEKLKNPVLAEFTGNYEFYHEEKYIVLTLYIENGKLMGIEPPDDPIEIKALNLEKLEFKAEEEGHEYFITFMLNEKREISGIKWVDEDVTLFAEKIKTRDKKSEFSVKELQEDFHQMRQTLQENHANLYEYTDKGTFDKLFEQQYNLIDKPMNLNEFFKLLTPITARVGCGHTNLWMPDEFWNSGRDKLFPLQITLIEGYAVVTGDYNSKSLVPVGSIVLEINDISINDIIEEMKFNYSADAMNENFILSQIERRFSLIYARRFGFPEKFTVTYALPGRKTSETAEFNPANIPAVRAVVFENFNHPELGFEVMQEKSTAIMTIQTFIYYDRVPMFKAFLESCFVEIHEKKIENLILDLRGNDGGDPFCAAPLFSYLEHEPVPYFAEPIPLAENRFTGNLFTLINGRCFSTNGHFCSLLKYHKIGKFVGSEGGATYKCNAGKNTQINLKNTRIMLYFGRSTYAAAVEGMDKTRGILPDYTVEQTYRDFLDGKDTIMEYTLKLIKSLKIIKQN
ncbi:MAG: hypothetical protein HQ534_07365 [Armatimonadetes bacterium]|nr:hypothetical protein [Armatimonadota bacterium]